MVYFNRRNALQWWRCLRMKDKKQFQKKYYPEHSFEYVSTSSLRIEQIYKKEKNEKGNN